MRIQLKIHKAHDGHVHMTMLVNGALAAQEIVVRDSEITEFLLLLDPERVEVDRENIDDNVFHRLAGFRQVWFV